MHSLPPQALAVCLAEEPAVRTLEAVDRNVDSLETFGAAPPVILDVAALAPFLRGILPSLQYVLLVIVTEVVTEVVLTTKGTVLSQASVVVAEELFLIGLLCVYLLQMSL